jgi:hypothetical protein
MKDYLALWAEGQPNENSRILASPITVLGEWGPRTEIGIRKGSDNTPSVSGFRGS